MTDKAAIRELREKVEAGTYPRPFVGVAGGGRESTIDGVPRKVWSLAIKAYAGSLDAALALHEAVLPRVRWEIWANADDYGCNVANFDTVYSDTPARSWLIAILKAMEND